MHIHMPTAALKKKDPVISEVALICGRVIIGGAMVIITLIILFVMLWAFHHATVFISHY